MSTAFEETAMRIDLFAHFTTQEFRQAYLSIPLGAKGRRLDPIAIRTFVQAQRTTDIDVLWDMEQRLTVLDRHGIDLQVLTLCFPMVGGLEPEEELRLARLANDGLAEIVQRYPHRFLGVATLPFSSPAEALREFDRCVDSLGFKGFQIGSNVNGILLDAPDLFPIYERAAQRGLPMWIHPTTPVMLDLVGTKGNADLLFGWPMDTSLALFRLVIGGVLEKLPQLKIIVHHLGAGMVPYFIERLDGLLPGRSGRVAHHLASEPLLEVDVPRYRGGGCQRLRLRLQRLRP
jgi:predicted TIM-barrel fold metal-dependent hydrolase